MISSTNRTTVISSDANTWTTVMSSDANTWSTVMSSDANTWTTVISSDANTLTTVISSDANTWTTVMSSDANTWSTVTRIGHSGYRRWGLTVHCASLYWELFNLDLRSRYYLEVTICTRATGQGRDLQPLYPIAVFPMVYASEPSILIAIVRSKWFAGVSQRSS